MADNKVLGFQGEEAAARFLVLRGYNIVERNWRGGLYEIDIIAQKRGVLVFVEVKTRGSEQYGPPEENVDEEKVRHILAAANAYVHIKRIDMALRFDIISVIRDGNVYKVRHFLDVFDETGWKDCVGK